MPSNIEIKARLKNAARTHELAERLSDAPLQVLEQRDTFFLCLKGRLKLREEGGGEGQLIHYHRADIAGTKQSDYHITRTTEPHALREILSAALGIGPTVIKTRHLYLVGQTRIHLDRVQGLGDFLELEVVLREDQSPEEGHRIARDLMAALEIRDGDLIEGAYADLLSSPWQG